VSFPGLSLDGRSAVVLGGTTGIGLALTRGLADAGADVIAASRRENEVDAAAREVEARGRRSLRQTVDVTQRDSLQALLKAALAAFGKVDVLVNCAGRTKRQPSLEMADADWDAIMTTNFTGTLRGCQVFAPHMLERGYGRIVNIASLASFVGLLDVAAYTASKSAVAGLTRALAVEWGPRGVNVNAIAPGVFRTALNTALLDSPRGKELLQRTPLGRFGKVEELQGACVFLCSESASFVNGELLTVDGGFLASGVNQ
jgi:NAD(P)-dependent dehydrogenase (short-subunit alcohol dehydrogenase family)